MKRLTWFGVVLCVVGLVLACSKLTGGKKADDKTPPPPPLTTVASAVEGKYAGTGANADGSTYKCDVEVKKAGDVYKVMWFFDGKPGYEGCGILKPGTFVVGFANASGYGVAAYAVNADGSMDGTWVTKGGNKAGSEKLTPVK